VVVVLTLDEGAGSINTFVEHFDRSYARRLQEISYADLLARGAAPRAAYVLADRNRMSLRQRQMTEAIRLHLREAGLPTYNDPLRQKGRYELQTALREGGINDFRVLRLNEDRSDLRFPVFVRRENDHNGPRTALVHTEEEILLNVDRLILWGMPKEDIVVVEFQDTQDPDGSFRKYGVWRLGDQFYGHHIFSGKDWLVKAQTDEKEQSRRESDDYFNANPHVDLVRPIFDLAAIEYGRIDFGFTNGRPQVWEINDNPNFVSAAQNTFGRIRKDVIYMEQLDRMAADVPSGPPISLEPLRSDLRGLLC
jgi:hypothetical protein